MKNLLYPLTKISLFLIATFTFHSLVAQNTMVVEGYDLGKRDLIFHPFGMDSKVNAGTIEKNGEFGIDFSSFSIETMNNIDVFMTDHTAALDAYCDEEMSAVEIEGEGKLAGFGHLYIYNSQRWLGLLIPASSQEVFDNINDPGYNNAVAGKYLQWYYSEKEFQYKASCNELMLLYDNSKVEIKKSLDLDLKQGVNLIVFEIEEVTQVKDAADMATTTKIYTVEEYPEDIVWFLKKF